MNKFLLVIVLLIFSNGCSNHKITVGPKGNTVEANSPEEKQEYRRLGAEFETDANEAIQLMDLVVKHRMWFDMSKPDLIQVQEQAYKLRELSKKYSTTKLSKVTTPLCESASSSLEFAATLTSMRQSENAHPGSVGEITLRQMTESTEQQAKLADSLYAIVIACKTMGDK